MSVFEATPDVADVIRILTRWAPMDDGSLAAALATSAGRLLLSLRRDLADPSTLRDRGDADSHALLVSCLAQLRPRDAVLSEEGLDDLKRLSADRVWIIDPLDGTREFGEEGRTDWAVHVALWAYGDLVAGAVALPALRMTFSTAGRPRIQERQPGSVRLAVSRTRPPRFAQVLAECLPAELVPMGSAGAKVMAIMRGEVDIYVHAGGQWEWDSAAPVAVARAAGLHVSRIDGSELHYNARRPYLPDLVVCRPEYARRVLAGLAAA